ncbi:MULTISPECIES: HNH endonuclease [Streptomyces]|uniref:Restriction endonuclease n=1 Tax=Streptomyces griseus TaxID=1911 RepID=A0A380MUT4_STRGR|nr:HNH endonuclease [Streptomyces griseus]SUO95127.1 restriction endonuclease [Streptomyces griseus]
MTRHLLARSLTKEQRRRRRVWLARRFGLRCAYCYRPFTFLEQATLDHVVPFSLYRTWAVQHLVLACRPCNQVKADRLPLSMALLLVHAAGSGESTANGLAGVAWPLLARLAVERQSAAREHQWATDEHPTGVREHPDRERDAARQTGRHRERSVLRRERRRAVGVREHLDREHPGRSTPDRREHPDRTPTERYCRAATADADKPITDPKPAAVDVESATVDFEALPEVAP